MKMTIEEFFSHLPKRCLWGLQGDKVRTLTNHRLSDDAGRACPITAVCHKLTGKQFSPRNYSEAATLIGLGPCTALRITLAADNYAIPGDDFHRELRLEVSQIRQRLLQVLGLRDKPTAGAVAEDHAYRDASPHGRGHNFCLVN
jgi:hypothetical protein